MWRAWGWILNSGRCPARKLLCSPRGKKGGCDQDGIGRDGAKQRSSPFWKQMHLAHSPFILCPMVFIKLPFGTSLVAQTVKRLPTMWEARVQSLGQEYLLEKEMAAHSSILAWKIPWTEEPGWLQSMGSQRVRHDWVSSLHFLCNIDNEPYICLVSISSRLCTFDNRDC